MVDNQIAEQEEKTEVEPKMKLKGIVSKIGLAGAVIDIGTAEPAAIHVSQIASQDNEPLKRVEDALEVGQEIDVWVRRIRNERIELTMFKPLDLEWREIKKGMEVKGTVVRLEKFGAFVEIGAERPGLIHISELTHGYVKSPEDVVKEGDEIEAEVIDVNRRKKQIKLSMKALEPKPEEIVAAMNTEENTEQKDKARKRKGKKKTDSAPGGTFETTGSDADPDTALAVALKEAMERAKQRESDDKAKAKKEKESSKEQEDILSRTLEQRSSS